MSFVKRASPYAMLAWEPAIAYRRPCRSRTSRRKLRSCAWSIQQPPSDFPVNGRAVPVGMLPADSGFDPLSGVAPHPVCNGESLGGGLVAVNLRHPLVHHLDLG